MSVKHIIYLLSIVSSLYSSYSFAQSNRCNCEQIFVWGINNMESDEKEETLIQILESTISSFNNCNLLERNKFSELRSLERTENVISSLDDDIFISQKDKESLSRIDAKSAVIGHISNYNDRYTFGLSISNIFTTEKCTKSKTISSSQLASVDSMQIVIESLMRGLLDKPIALKGLIRLEDNEPLINNASITVEELAETYESNKDGRFYIEDPNFRLGENITLIYNLEGFQELKETMSLNDFLNTITIVMQKDSLGTRISGEIKRKKDKSIEENIQVFIGETLKTTTDSEGIFKFRVAGSSREREVKLKFKHEQYKEKSIILDIPPNTTEYEIDDPIIITRKKSSFQPSVLIPGLHQLETGKTAKGIIL